MFQRVMNGEPSWKAANTPQLCCDWDSRFQARQFIYDSYANRKGKGTLKAIERFEYFSRKVSHNHTTNTFVLKADIKHYFESVNHTILINILKRKIKDKKIIWLIRKILSNYGKNGIGMPLGNLTSQFFANVYLNELDRFVKHQLKVEYYIRYVDDFVLLHQSKEMLQIWQNKIKQYLGHNLHLQLHPDKSKIISYTRGIEFLGMRIFAHHKLLKHKNIKKFHRRYELISHQYKNKITSYDTIYNFMEGWIAYAKQANTYNLRHSLLHSFEQHFPQEIAYKQIL